MANGLITFDQYVQEKGFDNKTINRFWKYCNQDIPNKETSDVEWWGSEATNHNDMRGYSEEFDELFEEFKSINSSRRNNIRFINSANGEQDLFSASLNDYKDLAYFVVEPANHYMDQALDVEPLDNFNSYEDAVKFCDSYDYNTYITLMPYEDPYRDPETKDDIEYLEQLKNKWKEFKDRFGYEPYEVVAEFDKGGVSPDLQWADKTGYYDNINSSRRNSMIKSSPNFKEFTADDIFDSFQVEELTHTVFMDREECKNARCGMDEFSTCMYDVLPTYLGVYTADDVREVCRRAKNPQAKAFLEAFETAMENARFTDKFYNSVKVHKNRIQSSRQITSGFESRPVYGSETFDRNDFKQMLQHNRWKLYEDGFNAFMLGLSLEDNPEINPHQPTPKKVKDMSGWDLWNLGYEDAINGNQKNNPIIQSLRQIKSAKSQEEFENLVIDIENRLGVNVEHSNIFNLPVELTYEDECYIDDICREQNCEFVPVNGSRRQYRLIQSSRRNNMIKSAYVDPDVISKEYRSFLKDLKINKPYDFEQFIYDHYPAEYYTLKQNGFKIPVIVGLTNPMNMNNFMEDFIGNITSAYTREDYDRFDEMGNFIPYKPTSEELAKKDEIKTVLKQELLDAYEPDPMDDYVGYDSTNERIDMACERVAKQFGVDTDFVEEIAGEIDRENIARAQAEPEYVYQHCKDKDRFWDWYNGEDVSLEELGIDKAQMNKEVEEVVRKYVNSSRQIKSSTVTSDKQFRLIDTEHNDPKDGEDFTAEELRDYISKNDRYFDNTGLDYTIVDLNTGEEMNVSTFRLNSSRQIKSSLSDILQDKEALQYFTVEELQGMNYNEWLLKKITANEHTENDNLITKLYKEHVIKSARKYPRQYTEEQEAWIDSSRQIKSSIITPWDTNQVTGTSDEDLGLSAVVDIYGNEFVNVDESTLNELKDTLVRYFDDEAYVRDWNINNPDYQIEDAFEVTDPEEMDAEDLARYFDYEAYGRDIRLEDNMVWDSENQYWISAHDVDDEELNNDKYIFMRG